MRAEEFRRLYVDSNRMRLEEVAKWLRKPAAGREANTKAADKITEACQLLQEAGESISPTEYSVGT